MKSASLRKLYTVGDAITSFKTAVAPDVDRSSIITLHFEPNGENISSDCLLAAIQSWKTRLKTLSISNALHQ